MVYFRIYMYIYSTKEYKVGCWDKGKRTGQEVKERSDEEGEE